MKYKLNIFTLWLLISVTAFGQTTKVEKSASTNNITEDLNIGTGRTLQVSGGTLDFGTGAVGSTISGAGGFTVQFPNGIEALSQASLPLNTTIGDLSSTEIGYLSTVTSDVQGQIDDKLGTTTAASTYQPLDSDLTAYAGASGVSTRRQLIGAIGVATETGSFTGVIGTTHVLTATGTVTDPTTKPDGSALVGGDSYDVRIQGSTVATVGGQTYTRGGFGIHRQYDGTGWRTFPVTIDYINPIAQAACVNAFRDDVASGVRPSLLKIGDSITAGASGVRSGETLAGAFWSQLGYGGPGLVNFATGVRGTGFEMLVGSTATNVNSTSTFASLGWSSWATFQSSGEGNLGFNGTAIYKLSASSQPLYIKFPKAGFTTVTIKYVAKVGGGNFDFGKEGDTVNVSCVSTTTELLTATRTIWTGGIEDCTIKIVANGDVYLTDIDARGGTGAVIGYSALGGTTAAQLETLNEAAYIRSIKDFNPSVVSIALGTNDSESAVDFQASMQELIDRVREGAPSAPIILVIPYTGAVVANGYYASFANLVAANANTFIFDTSRVLGNNPSTSDFLVDTVHPNSSGGVLLGKAEFEQIGGTALRSISSTWPASRLMDALPNVILDESRNAKFTASATDWVGQSGATITYLPSVGVNCVDSNGGGMSLDKNSGANFAELTQDKLYAARFTITLNSGARPQFRTYENSGFTFKAYTSWVDGSNPTLSEGSAVFVFRPVALGGDGINLYAAGATDFTLNSIKVVELPLPSPAGTIKGNNTSANGDTDDLTPSEVKALLAITGDDVTGITTLGTVTTGVWNGTAIAAAYGGTDQTSYTTGDILYASSSSALSKLSASTSGYVLTDNGAGVAPSWQAPAAAAAGTLTGPTLSSEVTASSLTSAAGGSFGTAAFTAATAYTMAPVAPPATASSTGTAGTWSYDSSYVYICVATDTWLRAAIATW